MPHDIWLYELAELRRLTPADVAAVKQVISALPRDEVLRTTFEPLDRPAPTLEASDAA